MKVLLLNRGERSIYLWLSNNYDLRTKLDYTKMLNIQIILTAHYLFSFLKLTAKTVIMFQVHDQWQEEKYCCLWATKIQGFVCFTEESKCYWLMYQLRRGEWVSALEDWTSTLHHSVPEDDGCKVGSKKKLLISCLCVRKAVPWLT